MKAMFLDESGNHGLVKLDPLYPLFVLGGVIVDAEYAEQVIGPRVRQFKLDLFGHADLVLHTADVSRNRNGFERLQEPAFRQRFYTELNRLMRELDYTVVACAIRKDAHLAKFGLAAVDPYLLSLDVLVEQFCFEIGDVEEDGVIYAEKRGPVLDRELDVAWLNLKIKGTEHLKASTINKRIIALHTRSKSAGLAGLELADLVVTPIGRHLLGKASHEDWAIVESKLRRRFGRYEGAGLVVLPGEASGNE